MAQQGEINQNQNVQGLFTEGSPLNFPAGATVRDENFILNTDGSRERRLGLGVEPNSQLNRSAYASGETYVFDWDAVGNDGNLNFAVIVTDGRISFYNKASSSLSEGHFATYTRYFFRNNNDQVAATTINGTFLLVGVQYVATGTPITPGATPVANPDVFVFTYNKDTNSLDIDQNPIKVRDIWGVDDPLEIDERPDSLSSAHAYNIANQGWKFAQARLVRDVGVTTETVTDPETGDIETIVTDDGGWPSNVDLVTYGISETDEDDRFKEKLYSTVPFGTTPAPKGACIVALTKPGQDRLDFADGRGFSAYTDIDDYSDYVISGPTAVASYAGRVFYAGFISDGQQVNETYPNLTNTIVFSRSVQTEKDVNKCYQQADPTTLDSEIVASDGGSLQIAGSGFIYKLVPSGRSLLVFASEGVWEIYSTDQLFSATNYQVRKLTDVGCKSPNSVILVENIPMYWTDYGIYALQPDQVSESFVATNITASTIQKYYDLIDAVSSRSAFGFYDKFDKKARWLWSSDGDNPFVYDRELIFDSRLQSWYTNVYPVVDNLVISGMVALNTFSEIEIDETVVAGEEEVFAGIDKVVVSQDIPEKGKRSYKYVIQDRDNRDYLFYEFNQANFKDFGTVDAEAVMITGPYTGGDSVRRKSSSYLTMQLRKTETGFQEVNGEIVPVNPSSCIVETRWDWTDLAKAGKFNNPIEMYRHRRHYIPSGLSDEYEDGNTVLTTKSRLRGSGKSLALKITSSPEKDLDILGYNIQISQNQKV